MPSMVIGTLLGVPYGDHEIFEGCSKRLLSGQSVEEVARARAELEKYLGELIDHKRREAGGGLLDDLMRLDTPTGPLSRDELIALSGMLLTAGHETTADMISLGAFTLLCHPEQLAALRAKETTMDVVVEEILRCPSVRGSGSRARSTRDRAWASVRTTSRAAACRPGRADQFQARVLDGRGPARAAGCVVNKMKIEVDLDRCVGAGMCALTAPAVFTQDDDGFSVVLPGQDTSADVHPMAKEAARACPVSAVSLLHED